MRRVITNVPDDKVGLTINLLLQDGLTMIQKIKENDTWTVIGQSPSAPAPETPPAAAPEAPPAPKPESPSKPTPEAPPEAHTAGGSAPTGAAAAGLHDPKDLKISDAAAAFIAGEEAFIAFRYEDVSNNATIGYGHHKGLTAAQIDAAFPDGLTEDQAWEVLLSDTEDFARQVRTRVTVKLTQYQMDALIMVAYHRGNIRPEAPLVNAGENERVAESIAGVTTTGGTYNAGIAARSRKVADLYLHGTYPAPKRTRSQLKAAGIQLVKDRYPDRLNTVGNNFGRPTEPAQKQQAAQAYRRMTGALP